MKDKLMEYYENPEGLTPKITKQKYLQLIANLEAAALAYSWIGGGDSHDIPIIEKELKEAHDAMSRAYDQIVVTATQTKNGK